MTYKQEEFLDMKAELEELEMICPCGEILEAVEYGERGHEFITYECQKC